MAFEVMLEATHYRSVPIKTMRNPFTGEIMVGDGKESFTPEAELANVRGFLARHGAVLDAPFEVRLPNASVSSTSIDEGGALVALRGDIAAWAAFLFELASAGDFAIQSMNCAPTMTTTAAARDRMSAAGELDGIVVVADSTELASYLAEEYREATGYIARVVSR